MGRIFATQHPKSLARKSLKKRSSKPLPAAGDEAATWAAKYAEQKPKSPSRILCYSVFVALQAPPASKIQQHELEEHVRAAATMKSSNSEEQRAKEEANINKQRDAGRARSAKAILAKTMQKRDFSPCGSNSVYYTLQYTIQKVQITKHVLHTILMVQPFSQYYAKLHSNMCKTQISFVHK